jgi:C4-dicarboxylate-binding protein DctP
MRTIKAAILGFLALCILFGLNPVIASAQKTYTIKIAHDASLESSEQMGFLALKGYVENASQGRLKADVYPAGQLAGGKEAVEMVKTGSVQMALIDSELSTFYPPIMVVYIPYLFPNEEVVLRFWQGPFFAELTRDMIKKAGLRSLWADFWGFKCFTNNKRPIKSPADLKGLKLRTQRTQLEIGIVEAFGAAATPVPWGELYTALQTKVVDGTSQPQSAIREYKFYETLKYFTLDQHRMDCDFTVIDEKFFQSLPPDLRLILQTGGQIGARISAGGNVQKNLVGALDFLKTKGIEVYVPTANEIKAFADVAQPALVKWLRTKIDNKWIDGAFKEVERIKAQMVAETTPPK